MNEEEDQKSDNAPVKKRNPITSVVVGAVGLFCGVYLLNFTAGGIIPLELPDAIPGIGNLDEAAAAALLVSCLAYFGLDIGGIFGRFNKDGTAKTETKEAKGKVIDG